MIGTRATLRNNVQIPTLGLGVYEIPKNETEGVVRSALDIGYRLIDTAAFYGNEREVGRAIKNSGIPRDEIFVTTKLHPGRFFGAEEAFHASLGSLALDYIDLYLIHWPFLRVVELWRALEKVYKQGFARAIGVSNFRIRDLKKINGASVLPMVNQIELHPFLYRKDLISYCASNGIAVEAHSPLTHGKRMNDPRIAAIAASYGRSIAQILIRWSLQHGAVVIPKTTHRRRLEENANVFDFSINPDDMLTLDNLGEDYHVAGLSKMVGDD
jgi:diketogulonate reductase-like aldo/keto reductase